MINEVQLVIKTGTTSTIEYTATFASCPQEGAIFCGTSRIVIDDVTLSPSVDDINAIWQQLADDGGTVEFFDFNDESTGTLTINDFNGYLSFVPDLNCSGIANDACYFKFTITTSNEADNYVDLYPNEVISQNWQFTDISTFQARGSFSREFRVPMSTKNVQLFNGIDNPNISNDYFNTKYAASIYINQLPIISGYVRVQRVNIQRERRSEIELAFYGEAPDIFTALQGKKVKDLTALPALTEPLIYDTLNYYAADSHFYSLIDRGQNWDDSGTTVNSRPVQNIDLPLAVKDLSPCFHVKWLMQQIFLDAGYRLVLQGLMSTAIDWYAIPWYISKDLILEGSGIAAKKFIAESTYNTFTEDGQYDAPTSTLAPTPFRFDNITLEENNSYIDPNTENYNLRFSHWPNINAACAYKIHLYVKSSSYVKIWLYKFTNITAADIAGSGTFLGDPTPIYYSGEVSVNSATHVNIVVDTGFLPINQGDAVFVIVDTPLSGSVKAHGSDGVGETFWECYDIALTQNINYVTNAPDINQQDIVSDIIKMHNCVIVPSKTEPKVIELWTMHEYFSEGDVIDWTTKIDYSKDVVITPATEYLRKKLSWSYTKGDDYYSGLYSDAGRVYGEYQLEPYITPSVTTASPWTQGENKITLVAKSTPCSPIVGTYWGGLQSPPFVIPKIYKWSGGANAVEFIPTTYRILQAAGALFPIAIYNDNTNAAEMYVGNGIVGLSHIRNGAYPIPATAASNNSILFAPEVELYPTSYYVNKNLFTMYWMPYLDAMYSPLTKVMDCFVNLSVLDVAAFEFNQAIWIKDSYWRVLSITDYQMGMNNTTKVRLIKTPPINPTFIDTPPTCCPIDKIELDGTVFFDADCDATQLGTEQCCKDIGYTWTRGVRGVRCYANRPPTGGITNTGKPDVGRPVKTDASNPKDSVTLGTNVSVTKSPISNLQDTHDGMYIAVGKDITAQRADTSAFFGKNILSMNKGLHVGGGYRASDTTAGSMQSGQILLSNSTTWYTCPQTEMLTLDAENSPTPVHIMLPDNTGWSMHITLTALDVATGDYVVSTMRQYIYRKSTGVQLVGAVYDTTDDSSFGAYSIRTAWDEVTNGDEFRLYITLDSIPTGMIAPNVNVNLVADIKYTQVR